MGGEAERPKRDILSGRSRWSEINLRGKLSLSELDTKQKVGIVVMVLSAALVMRHFVKRSDGERVDVFFPSVSDDEVGLKDGDVAEVLGEVGIEPSTIDKMRQSDSRFRQGFDSILSIFRRRDARHRRITGEFDPDSERIKAALLNQLADVLPEDEREELTQADWGVIMAHVCGLLE